MEFEGVTIFIDDVWTIGESDEICLQRLKQVFERLREYNIRIKKRKLLLKAHEITYCDIHLINMA